MSAYGTKQTCQCADECPLLGAKRTLTNRRLPISIYEYTALGKIEKNPQRLKLANASSRKFARPFLTRRLNIRASLREVTVIGGSVCTANPDLYSNMALGRGGPS